MSEPVRCNCQHDVAELPFGAVVGGETNTQRWMIVAVEQDYARAVLLTEQKSMTPGRVMGLSGEGWYVWEAED